MSRRHAPRIGITVVHDDGAHPGSFRPDAVTHLIDDADVQAIVRAGGIPFLLPVFASETVVEGYIRSIDGLLVTGGGEGAWRRHPDSVGLPGLRELSPQRYEVEAMLIRKALDADMTVLGIVRAHPVLADVGGGRMLTQIEGRVEGALQHSMRDAPVGMMPVHSITVQPETLLHSLVGQGTIGVNSLHRQAVESV